MKFFLLGYMGVGKTTLGTKIAKTLNIPFIDLDLYIEKHEGKTISQIFSKYGEVYFRTHEHKYLKQILDKEGDCIVSLGGGTPCYANNMDLIKSYENTRTIYLKASIDTIYKRIKKNKGKRPIISSLKSDDLKEFIAKHIFERAFYYNQSDVKIEVDGKFINEIIVLIINSLS